MCRVNASTIHTINNGVQSQNIKSVDFEFEQAMSLIGLHIEQQNLSGRNSSVVCKIEITLFQACKNVKLLFSSSK